MSQAPGDQRPTSALRVPVLGGEERRDLHADLDLACGGCPHSATRPAVQRRPGLALSSLQAMQAFPPLSLNHSARAELLKALQESQEATPPALLLKKQGDSSNVESHRDGLLAGGTQASVLVPRLPCAPTPRHLLEAPSSPPLSLCARTVPFQKTRPRPPK